LGFFLGGGWGGGGWGGVCFGGVGEPEWYVGVEFVKYREDVKGMKCSVQGMKCLYRGGGWVVGRRQREMIRCVGEGLGKLLGNFLKGEELEIESCVVKSIVRPVTA